MLRVFLWVIERMREAQSIKTSKDECEWEEGEQEDVKLGC